tara:strand:- start:210 stop:338 length:129 start_codon:yes stop_codon:yes gene_type:complete
MKCLVWLRADLRTEDNPSLKAACKLSEEQIVLKALEERDYSA